VGQTPGETRRLTLREASDRSGIPLDALRKRVYRGNIPAAKVDGAYTILETDLVAIVGANGHTPPVDRTLGETVGETVLGRGSDTGEAMSDGLALDYIASLKDEIAFLRRELETRTDELQRRDVLLREALQRVPQLAAGETARSSDTGPVDSARPGPNSEATGGAETNETHRESVVLSLWRRVWGQR
jgi:hypothetical protein